MLKIKNYVKAESLEQAYELNQKRSACILGGMVWLKMGNRNVSTAIDLSGLGLSSVRETEEGFEIGSMVTLRTLETHTGLNRYTGGAMKESLRHIVGVQFRNCATVGGSLWGRYGFSDVLTMFLALDAQVELYHAGKMSLREFAERKKDRDILVHIFVKKAPLHTVYLSQRNSETDFPVLTCAASLYDGAAKCVIGARPGRAAIVEDENGILNGFADMAEAERKEAAHAFAEYAASHVTVGGNMRASAEYRKHLVRILTGRAWEAVGGMTDEN